MINVIPFPETRKSKSDGQSNSADFEPDDFSPIPPVGAISAEIVARLAFRRQVKQLHTQGPRALAEFLAEVAVRYSLADPILELLDRYHRVPGAALDVTGGNNFWPVPTYDVSQLLRNGATG